MPELSLPTCRVTIDGVEHVLAVRVDGQALTLAGKPPMVVPLKEVTAVHQRGKSVEVLVGKQTIALTIGPAAEAWWRAIRYPKSLMDKLELKPEKRIWIKGLTDGGLVAEITGAFPAASTRSAKHPVDTILFGAEDRAALSQLEHLRAQIVPNGTVWVIYPKGLQTIKEHEVRAAGLAAGLVDTKICRVSETHTGLKFVIPVAQRGASSPTKSEKPAPKGWTAKPAREAIAMPADIETALRKSSSLWAFFTWLPRSHQKAYVEYITEAKRPATRANRIAQTLERLRAEMTTRLR